MSGQLPVEPHARVRVAVEPRTVTRAAAAYSWALALAGVAVLIVLVARGASLPPLVPTVLLVVVVALCIGRVALYPSELAATAELAVLLCAVTAFRESAPVTGPLLLALLVGPLDRDHWRERSFVRMAYNSGDRALAALGAAGAFAGVTALLGSSVGALVAATAVAATAATALDGAATVGLVVALGGNARAARRELLDIDALALPLAAIGGAVGVLATGVGWWAAALPLGLLALVPELVQARARIPARFARNALLAGELVVALVAVGVVAEPPAWPTALVLVGLALLVGMELVVDDRVPVPPVLGIVVVVAAVTAGGAAAVFAGALVGALATASAWWWGRCGSTRAAAIGVAVAAGAGVLAGSAASVAITGPMVVWGIAAAALALFAVPAMVLARSPWRRELVNLGWAAPLLVAPIAVAVVPALGLTAAAAASGALLLVLAALGAWCGATPWRSRVLSRAGAHALGRGRTPVFLVLCGAVVVAAAIGLAQSSTIATPRCAWAAVALLACAAIMALWATRQWRLAPRARVRQSALLGAAVVAACIATALAHEARFDASLLCSTAAALVVACAGRASVRLGDRAH